MVNRTSNEYLLVYSVYMLLFRYILLASLLTPFAASAKEVLTGPVVAQVIEVKDGDTLDVTAMVWLGQTLTTAVRVGGIDTPENRGKCAAEKAKARAATDFLRALVADGHITLTNIQYGKYAGRVVADVSTSDGTDVSQRLIDAGHARAYHGGKRQGWCDAN